MTDPQDRQQEYREALEMLEFPLERGTDDPDPQTMIKWQDQFVAGLAEKLGEIELRAANRPDP